jgi:hypothetical protein
VGGDDKVVAGPGAGDVEQADPFMVVHLFIDGFGGVEGGRLHILAEPQLVSAATGPEYVDSGADTAGPAGHAGEDDDGEFESLRGMDGHDAYGVGVGFGEDGGLHGSADVTLYAGGPFGASVKAKQDPR